MGDLIDDRERRRSFRIAVPGTALLWSKREFAGRYSVANLSIGGCLIAEGPPADLGQVFEVALHVGQRDAVRVPARVVRRVACDAGRPSIGLRFTKPSPATEDCIQDLILRDFEASLPRENGLVLLIGGEFLATHPLVEAIQLLGHEVALAATPLDAVWALESRGARIHTAVVSQGAGGRRESDFVRLLALRYPHVRRILVTEDPQQAPPPDSELVLSMPWDLSRLRRALPDTEPAAILHAG